MRPCPVYHLRPEGLAELVELCAVILLVKTAHTLHRRPAGSARILQRQRWTLTRAHAFTIRAAGWDTSSAVQATPAHRYVPLAHAEGEGAGGGGKQADPL
jgi:hypothetical protein